MEQGPDLSILLPEKKKEKLEKMYETVVFRHWTSGSSGQSSGEVENKENDPDNCSHLAHRESSR